MPQVTISLFVDAAKAVRELHSRAGLVQLALSEADLAALDDDERETLARHLDATEEPDWPDDGPRWGDPLALHTQPIGHADFPMLRTLLRERHRVMSETYVRWMAAKEREAKEREAIAKAIEAVDPTWLSVYRDGEMSEADISDVLSRHVLADVDRIALRNERVTVAKGIDTMHAATLTREQHARKRKISEALPPGWTWVPMREGWCEHVVSTYLECRGTFQGVPLAVAYDLDHDPPPPPANELEQRASDETAIGLQRQISERVRNVSGATAATAADSIRRDTIDDSYETLADVVTCALAAAVHDDVIWAALANVRTEIVHRRELAKEGAR